MIGQCLKGAAAMAFALAAAACGSNLNVTVGEGDGVPLSELDTGGTAPTRLVLASPDNVVVTEGSTLGIKVSGDQGAIDALRFNLENGRLGIMREKRSTAKGKATIAVTMPPAHEFVLAGSGDITASSMADDAEINIAGSGRITVAAVKATSLNVNVMGSGTLAASGSAKQLDFNLAGSGRLAARYLAVEQAKIAIAGSGGGEFSSDGKVTANVAGSGEVTVYGRADCSISAVGSGKLHCRNETGAGAPPAPRE